MAADRHAAWVAADLNQRFLAGNFSSTPRAAGLFLHTFDRIDDADVLQTPWIPKGGVGGDPSNRLSACVINALMPREPGGELPLFSFGLGGYVLSPEYNRIRCSYALDDGSIRFGSRAWGPGCAPFAFQPERLDAMLIAHARRNRTHGRPNSGGRVNGYGRYYNEVIFDVKAYKSNLPRSIEAVFFITTPAYSASNGANCSDARNSGEKCEAYTRVFHSRFRQAFGNESRVPLLHLDVMNWRAPFSAPARHREHHGEHLHEVGRNMIPLLARRKPHAAKAAE